MLAIPNVEIAAPADARAIAELSRHYIEHGLGWSWTPARVTHAMCDPSTNVAVIRQRGSVVAFGIMQYADDTAHLSLLAVDPTQRHRGLGARMVEWLERSARAAGIRLVRLEARADNHSAIAFYERLAFTRCGRIAGYYEGRIDAVQLERSMP